MSKSLKGALLSGLIFPGLGQVIFKHYKQGITLIVLVFGSLIVIVVIAVQKAFTIIEKIALEGKTINIDSILNAVTQASTTYNSSIINLAWLVIIACWIFGTIDAYRIGKKMDRGEQSTSPSSNDN